MQPLIKQMIEQAFIQAENVAKQTTTPIDDEFIAELRMKMPELFSGFVPGVVIEMDADNTPGVGTAIGEVISEGIADRA